MAHFQAPIVLPRATRNRFRHRRFRRTVVGPGLAREGLVAPDEVPVELMVKANLIELSGAREANVECR